MKSILLVFFIFFPFVFSAQTIGVSEVIAVENKVSLYESNVDKINKLRNEIPEMEKQWKENIAKLSAEIAALNLERDNLIADMKVGARCSQCGGWKSDFEKKGENFEKHLGDVKGYAIPATTGEIETTRKSYSEKIAIKKVHLQNLEKGDKSILKQYDQIDKLIKDNEKLCDEITKHSKSYEQKLFDDAKSKHDFWLEDVLSSGSKAFVESSNKKLLKAKKNWLEQEFVEKNIVELKKIKDENQQNQDNKKQQIAENEIQISNLKAEQIQQMESFQTELDELFKRLKELEDEYLKETNEAIKDQLNETKEGLSKQVLSLKEKMVDYVSKSDQNIAVKSDQNSNLYTEITQLVGSLNREQIQKTKELNEELALKLEDLKKLESLSEINYKKYLEEYNEKLKEYKQKNDAFVREITLESNRMLLAARRTNCSVWNETSGKVTLNWNKKIPCVNKFAFPETIMIEEVIGNSSCSSDIFFKKGTSIYKSFYDGLSEKEKRVL